MLSLILCSDLHRILKFSCCVSCHDDQEYGYDLMEYETEKHIVYHCCGVSREQLEKLPDEEFEKMTLNIEDES